MRILYVIRDRSGRNWKKRLHRWTLGFLDGQDGFFEASLHKAGRVTRRTMGEALAMRGKDLGAFDAIVVNNKCGPRMAEQGGYEAFAARLPDRPHGLFIGNARPQDMPSNAALGAASVIFKREPWADLDRYGLPAPVADRIVPTHLSNPLAPMSWRIPAWERHHFSPSKMAWEVPAVSDVGFIGASQNSTLHQRLEAWAAIIDAKDLTSEGGIIEKKGQPVPEALRANRMDKPAYLKSLQTARVNLGLEGIGPFTFRHLEVMWSGGFLLSNPIIRAQRLRAPLIEGQDYVAFDDLDDMVEKTRHYARADKERLAIAKAGRAAYERLHDVDGHAEEIRQALSQ